MKTKYPKLPSASKDEICFLTLITLCEKFNAWHMRESLYGEPRLQKDRDLEMEDGLKSSKQSRWFRSTS